MSNSTMRVKAKLAQTNEPQVQLYSNSLSLINKLQYQIAGLKIAFNKIIKTPAASLLTFTILGIALSLPCLLYLFLTNIEKASEYVNRGNNITLYLKVGLADNQAIQLASQIGANRQIEQVNYISPEQGLNQFAKQAGLTNLLENLPNNPLPGVLLVTPKKNFSDPKSLEMLNTQLEKLPQVEQSRLDMFWVKRLTAFTNLAQHITSIVTIFLGLAVILVISNTLRLMVQSCHEEIEVAKLVGATNQFVLRPFFYAGMLYGLFGALFAILFLFFSWIVIEPAVLRFVNAYQSNFIITGFSLGHTLTLLFFGVFLGSISTFISVRSYLFKINP